MLPEYRQAARDWALRGQAPQYATTLRDVLIRYSGALKELEADARKESSNPIIWFSEGVKTVLSSPFRLLSSLGVLSGSVTAGIVGSNLLRVASGVIALVALTAGLVQTITGWDTSLALLTNWIRTH